MNTIIGLILVFLSLFCSIKLTQCIVFRKNIPNNAILHPRLLFGVSITFLKYQHLLDILVPLLWTLVFYWYN
jgi:hypothetical protein